MDWIVEENVRKKKRKNIVIKVLDEKVYKIGKKFKRMGETLDQMYRVAGRLRREINFVLLRNIYFS